MSWICATEFSGHSQSGNDKTGSFGQSGAKQSKDLLLARGSVVAEFDMGPNGRAPTRLVHFHSDENWQRRFTIFLNADYSVSVEVQQGMARSYVRLTNWQSLPTKRARLTYAWDGPAKLGLLTIECLETGQVSQTMFDAPVPMPLSDIEKITDRNEITEFDSRLNSIALSNGIEPVGPAPSISEGTLVETADGPRLIERLQLGDMVQTARHGFQPIRWLVKQNVPAVGDFRPIKLRAPYLDLQQDITVTQNQRMLFSGAEAEYLFGEDSVLIEARQLLGHPCATLQPAAFSRTYYQILLDHHDCIRLCGAWSESLYVGYISDAPQVLATSRLASLPRSAMPVHRKFSCPMLGNYESRTLLDSLSA